jgi:hypothetical protein
MTKKTWVKPEIEVLDVKLTMAGPGVTKPDSVQPDVDEVIHYS